MSELQVKLPPDRPQRPGFLERLGVNYYVRLARHKGIQLRNPADLPSDAVLRRRSTRIALFGMAVAFLIGALTTVATVWVEMEFEADLAWYHYYGLQGTATVLMFVLEFVVLFWVAMRTVYHLARLTGLAHLEDEPLLPESENVPNLLARAALEIPDPVYDYLGINPLQHVSKTKLTLIGLLYKSKVFLTNAASKYLIRTFVQKPVMGLPASWITVPITGLWNAFVIWKVVREARLRLFGYWLVQHLTREILTEGRLYGLSDAGRKGCIQAVACVMVLTQNHHPNMLMLIVRTANLLGAEPGRDYDDWPAFLETLSEVPEHERFLLLDLLCVAAALDGRLSRMEKSLLVDAFGKHSEAYFGRIRNLKHQLLTGRLHAAIASADLDFRPG